jgi:hypothetical protein
MGESFRYASVDSLDMSWLPLSRFESRAVCVVVFCRERGSRVPHPISVGSRRRGISVRPWMGESFRYASTDSLDMSWLPLSRFESRSACVAVSRRVRGPRVPQPISVGSRRRGISARPWMGESLGYASADSLDMSWLPQPLHSPFRPQGWGVRLHLFLAGSRFLFLFWLLRGHFGDFAMKSSAGGHGSYASCYFICADIKIK